MAPPSVSDRSITIKLLNHIQQHSTSVPYRAIWDRSSPSYNNQNFRDHMWECIANELGEDVQHLKDRWLNSKAAANRTLPPRYLEPYFAMLRPNRPFNRSIATERALHGYPNSHVPQNQNTSSPFNPHQPGPSHMGVNYDASQYNQNRSTPLASSFTQPQTHQPNNSDLPQQNFQNRGTDNDSVSRMKSNGRNNAVKTQRKNLREKIKNIKSLCDEVLRDLKLFPSTQEDVQQSTPFRVRSSIFSSSDSDATSIMSESELAAYNDLTQPM